MTRAVGPHRGLGPQASLSFTLLGLCWAPVGLAGAIWIAGHSVSWLSAKQWSGPPFNTEFAILLLANGVGPLWPNVNAPLIWTITALLVLIVFTPIALLTMTWAKRPQPGAAIGSMARTKDVTQLCTSGVATKALQLRPSLRHLKAKNLDPHDTGIPLGLLRPTRTQLRACWEDVLVVFMAPRSGKTSEVAAPQVLAAPGAVLATSNKADLWALTAAARRRSTRERDWVFDPQRIAGTNQTWWWNPLAGVTTVESAQRLTSHFIAEVRGDKQREFWSSAAEDVLASLFLAAGSTGRTLVDVYDWLNRTTSPIPVDLLRNGGHVASANGLQARQSGAVETREGVFETARVAAKCLRDPNIMAWVTPPTLPLEEFDSAGFAATRETLYLLTKDGAGGAAPLVAAFADRVMQDATRLAERRGGRLDPPMVAVLDEAANICKIADLPQLYSHLGSRGIIPVTILQSYPQGVGVWGETGMATLWAASTIKIIGAGLDDDKFLDKVSKLIGDHDVPMRAINQGTNNQGESISLRRQRILAPEALRELAKGTAVLLATGCRPALLEMQPWYRGPHASQIQSDFDAALAMMTHAANTPIESNTSTMETTS
ncbi:MAG: type IV secretory system conjugative DNA transfer family protein [Acidimicrobiales bacterium]